MIRRRRRSQEALNRPLSARNRAPAAGAPPARLLAHLARSIGSCPARRSQQAGETDHSQVDPIPLSSLSSSRTDELSTHAMSSQMARVSGPAVALQLAFVRRQREPRPYLARDGRPPTSDSTRAAPAPPAPAGRRVPGPAVADPGRRTGRRTTRSPLRVRRTRRPVHPTVRSAARPRYGEVRPVRRTTSRSRVARRRCASSQERGRSRRRGSSSTADRTIGTTSSTTNRPRGAGQPPVVRRGQRLLEGQAPRPRASAASRTCSRCDRSSRFRSNRLSALTR